MSGPPTSVRTSTPWRRGSGTGTPQITPTPSSGPSGKVIGLCLCVTQSELCVAQRHKPITFLLGVEVICAVVVPDPRLQGVGVRTEVGGPLMQVGVLRHEPGFAREHP